MSPAASSAVLQWFLDYFSPDGSGVLGSIVYEMFRLQDSFGRVMVDNLKVRCFTGRFLFSRFTSTLYRHAKYLSLAPNRTRMSHLSPDVSLTSVLRLRVL
jgi:hypothetical protein